MYFFKTIIDIIIVALLLRLLIRPREAFFDPIYGLIYRITEPLLTPAKYVTRNINTGAMLTILALAVLRGVIYVSVKGIPFMWGLGVSLLGLLQLLFQAYMAMWFISFLSRSSYGSPFMDLIERAFLPLNGVLRRLGIPIHRSQLFTFLFLWFLYAFLALIINYVTIPKAILSSVSAFHGLGEGLMLAVGLFPGFFSIVIIVGVLLSWVSPDPSNPVVQAIYGISEPLLAPFRRFVPLLGGLDISPIFALLCFQILGRLAQDFIAGLMKMV